MTALGTTIIFWSLDILVYHIAISKRYSCVHPIHEQRRSVPLHSHLYASYRQFRENSVENLLLESHKKVVMNEPALAPPLGVTSNFVDPYTLKPVLIITTAVYIILTTFGIGARLAVRIRTNESMLLEDCQYSIPSWMIVAKDQKTRLFSPGFVNSRRLCLVKIANDLLDVSHRLVRRVDHNHKSWSRTTSMGRDWAGYG